MKYTKTKVNYLISLRVVLAAMLDVVNGKHWDQRDIEDVPLCTVWSWLSRMQWLEVCFHLLQLLFDCFSFEELLKDVCHTRDNHWRLGYWSIYRWKASRWNRHSIFHLNCGHYIVLCCMKNLLICYILALIITY